jgi:hypothetical protein
MGLGFWVCVGWVLGKVFLGGFLFLFFGGWDEFISEGWLVGGVCHRGSGFGGLMCLGVIGTHLGGLAKECFYWGTENFYWWSRMDFSFLPMEEFFLILYPIEDLC